ncbi:hypothetical protein [Nocardiopsis sp. CNR-923]|uniref:hypothetical protein n=1 Tax=Nocardiopsis sp. CNR-923 TaxID=1904965 RepID=UPI0021CCC83D|nr:hypothetical protein [Nocardiopsis sp. CNR-923]
MQNDTTTVDTYVMRDDESTPAQPQDITAHPGWFGSGYGGSSGTLTLAIHADWPAYPCAPGGLHGLFDLAQFPEGTLFDPIDDIDRCVLFVAYKYDPKKPDRPKDPFSVDAYQVAIWHEDLLSLQEQGLSLVLRRSVRGSGNCGDESSPVGGGD